MSSLKRSLFGEKGTPSQVVDSTPDEFAALRQPFGAALLGGIQNPAQFQGQFAAPLGQGEQQALGAIQNAAGSVGQNLTGQNMLGGAAGFNPFAQLSGLEQFGVGQVANQAFGQNPFLAQAQQTAFGQNPLQDTSNAQLQQLIGSGGAHPQLDQLIQAATRPILEQFGDDQLAQRGAFTGAGHQVQGQGSSPFAQASARLSSGVANALGDTGAQLTAQLNAQQQQAQLQGLGLAQGQQGLNLQGAGVADALTGNQLQRAISGLGAAGLGQERQGQAFEQQQGRQLAAGGQLGQQELAAQQGQLQAQLQNLQAQGLPRMIQQLGLEGGLQEFQRQQQQMMQLMQIMGGVTAPNQAVLPGTPGSTGALGALAGGVGQGFGTALSDRRMKRDITPIGEINGVKIYNFRHVWDADDRPLRTGVMADEVMHIPGAVMVDDITGLATVDYGRVAQWQTAA